MQAAGSSSISLGHLTITKGAAAAPAPAAPEQKVQPPQQPAQAAPTPAAEKKDAAPAAAAPPPAQTSAPAALPRGAPVAGTNDIGQVSDTPALTLCAELTSSSATLLDSFPRTWCSTHCLHARCCGHPHTNNHSARTCPSAPLLLPCLSLSLINQALQCQNAFDAQGGRSGVESALGSVCQEGSSSFNALGCCQAVRSCVCVCVHASHRLHAF